MFNAPIPPPLAALGVVAETVPVGDMERGLRDGLSDDNVRGALPTVVWRGIGL